MPSPTGHLRGKTHSEGDVFFNKFGAAVAAADLVPSTHVGGGSGNSHWRRANSIGRSSSHSHDESDNGDDGDDVSYYGQNYDDEDVHRAPRDQPTTTATTTTPTVSTPRECADAEGSPAYDLCGSMWKRRGGLGRNAERKWVVRAFTLQGPRLCYHEESEFDSITYPSKPRASLDLSKVETIAEMHSKQKRGLPSSELLTINIYDPIVHAKRKWEMCCTTKEQQLLWYRAIKAFDGKPTTAPGQNCAPHSPLEGGVVEREVGTTASPPTSPPAATTMTSATSGRPMPLPPYTTTTLMKSNAMDDIDIIARAAARAAEIIIEERQQTKGIVHLFDGTIVSFAAIVNFVIYIARNESFWMTVGVVNAFVMYVTYCQYTKHGGSPSRTNGPRARAAAIRSTKRRTGSEEYSPTTHPYQQQKQRPGPMVSFVKALPSGRTIPRGFSVRNGEMEGMMRTCGAAVAEVGPHSYGDVDAPLFQLRVGPNYKKNKQKGPSGPALYQLLTMDFLFADAPLRNASDKFRIPNIPGITDISTGHAHIPPLLIINTWLPGEEPSMFGKSVDESAYSIPMIFVLSQSTLDQLRDIDNASAGVKLLSAWCRHAEYDPDFRGRFKCMGMIEDIESTNVPKFIQGYNGKPALVTKSGTFTRRDNYIEFTINVNMWAFLAKKGLFALIPTFPDFIFNVGFTIEARSDEEMPEVLLGGCRLMNLDPDKAVVDGIDDIEI